MLLSETLLEKFKGIRVIPDVHGEAAAFSSCLEDAKDEGLFVIQLGDLTDFGPDSIACLKLVIDLVDSKYGIVLKSNHEDKLFRYLIGNDVDTSIEPFASTLTQILNTKSSREVLHTFVEQYSSWPYWVKYKSYAFVHAAFLPEMLEYSAPHDANEQKLKKKLKTYSLYGETSAEVNKEGLPTRTYNWVDKIPDGQHVLVGHDIRSFENPVEKCLPNHSKVTFLDTGCGKGGIWSYKNIIFD